MQTFLWESTDATRNVAEAAVATSGVRSIVFTSSNCLWAEKSLTARSVKTTYRLPIEIYGRSKWEGEKILAEYADRLNVVSIRCPTILDEGRLGLLAILFEFIKEGRKVWVVGGGQNRYQFIHARDLADACLKAEGVNHSAIYNIGSDDVGTFRETYQYVIDRAGTGARIANLPKAPTLAAMQLAHLLRVSPLGPYQYRMIAEDFVFDTSRIKSELGWAPTMSNAEMLWRAYNYYQTNRKEIEARTGVSAGHRQPRRWA